MGTLGSNGLIMMTLIYTKQTIHVIVLLDEISFFARDRLLLVLGQKGDLATRYLQIICYARLLLKYTNMYLFTDKVSTMNLWGLSDHVLPPYFLVCRAWTEEACDHTRMLQHTPY